MQLALKLRFLNLLLAPERNRPPREQRFPGSEQMFELPGGREEDTCLKVLKVPKNTARSQRKCKASPSTWAKLTFGSYRLQLRPPRQPYMSLESELYQFLNALAPFRKNSIVTGFVPLFRHAWRVPFCTTTSPGLR